MSNVLLAFGFGLVTASILALGAVGFTLQFGVTNVFNLAFGDVMTIGMFAAYVVNVPAHASIWLALCAAAIAGAMVMVFLHRTVFIPFIKRGSPVSTIIFSTLALAIIIQNVLLVIAGSGFYALRRTSSPAVSVAGMLFDRQQIAIIVIAVVTMLALHALLRFTRLGKAMRATAADEELARNCGVSTNRVATIAWMLSGGLCGLAGAAFAMNLAAFDETTGGSFLLIIVAAAVFGGVGQPYGAMLGALVIGVSTELAALISPDLKEVVAFALLALMLLVRPNGLLGKPLTRTSGSVA